MALKLVRSVTGLPLLAHAGAATASLIAFNWIKGHLDASYAASQHPVDYMTGQTGFSGPQIKSYYAQMQDAGTLDVYWTTQMIDYGFLGAMFALGLFLCTLIARIGRPESRGRQLGLMSALCVMTGAVCDAIENAWSFVMLSDPLSFADWLALPYSGFAVLKFAFITLGMGLLVAGVAVSLLGRALGKAHLG